MNNPELLAKLSSTQAAVWPAVMNGVSEACGQAVQFNSPLVLEGHVGEVLQEFAAAAVLVQFSFAGQSASAQCLILPLDTAAALHAALVEEPGDFDEGALEEIRAPLEAIVQGICLGLGNSRSDIVIASDLSLKIGRFARPASLQPTDTLVRVQVALSVESTIGSLTWLLDVPTAHFVANLPLATPAAFEALPSFGSSRSDESHGLDILMDIPLDISVELGRTRMVVKEVVDLGIGSIIEIEKAAGEPVDVMVNGRLVARGEVVVIEDNFGVRITEILNPRERVARLGEAA